jgi:hypothetical protein
MVFFQNDSFSAYQCRPLKIPGGFKIVNRFDNLIDLYRLLNIGDNFRNTAYQVNWGYAKMDRADEGVPIDWHDAQVLPHQ